jgi:hypothetical protein
MDLTLFHKARQALGIKRLYQNNKEILFNDCDVVEAYHTLEARADDGVTILATIKPYELRDAVIEQEEELNIISWPDDLMTDDEYEYCLTVVVHAPPEHSFFKMLGAPFFSVNEGKYHDFPDISPIHFDLVRQWRDLQELHRLEQRADELHQKILSRAREKKRPRRADDIKK